MNDPLSSLPGYVMRRASAVVHAELGRRLDQLSLKPTELSTLILINANPGITQSELCRALDVQRANMTPLIARLEERGFIERVAVDGRSQALSLSAEGTRATKTAFQVIEAFEAELVSHLPTEHRDHLLPALAALWVRYSV
jgi:DNA-binding MarR family transcriptional regulator